MWFERFINLSRKNRPSLSFPSSSLGTRSKKAKSARPLVEPLEARNLLDAFTAGNLIATVVGAGSPLTGNATETFINEYRTLGGAAVQSIGLPTTGGSAFTEKGTAAGEGYLTSSADGHTASLAGYNVDAGNSTDSTNSLIGIVNPNGSIDSSTVLPSGDTGGSVKATVSADGLGMWVATAKDVRYVPFGNSALTPTTAVTNWLQGTTTGPNTVAIGSSNDGAIGTGNPGQLFVDAGVGGQSNGIGNIDGPVQIGHYSGGGFETNDGLPNVAGQPGTILRFPTARDDFGNFPTSNQIVISPDGNTIFVADSRTDTLGGILEFFQITAGSWFEVGQAQVDATADGGLRALVGDFSNPSAPILYGTTTKSPDATSGNRIVKITGGTTDGNTPAFTFTTVETAAANTAFRGVALAPTAPGAAITTTTLTVTGSPGSYPGAVTLSATVAGTSPTGYVSFLTAAGVEIGAAPLVGGTATLVPASNLQVAASGSIVAAYTGDIVNAPSTSAAGTATVTPDMTTTALAAQFTFVATGVSDTLSVQVTYAGGPSAAPTGTVTFWQDAVDTGINLGTFPLAQTIVNVGGTPTIEFLASTSTTFDTTELKHMFAVYNGDSNFQTSQGAQDVTVVLSSTTTVTTNNANPTASGDSVTLTATVTGTGATPTGTVAFYDNSLLIAANVALDGSGMATTTLTTSLLQQAGITLLPGLQSITAIYSGDAIYFQSSGVYDQAVQAQAFAAGDVFVYRVGDGTTGLIAPPGNPNAGAASIGSTIYIDEINPAGINGSNVVQSIILPTADGQGDQVAIHAIVGNGQQSGTGQITVSGDGNYLFLVGYDTNPLSGANASGTGIGTTAPAIPNGPGHASVSRAVARIDMSGNVQDVAFVAGSSGVQTGGNFNGVYSPDGIQFYISGTGVDYFASFSPSAALQTATARMTTPTGTVTALEPSGTDLALVNSVASNSNPVQSYTGFPITASSANNLPGVTGAAAVAGGQASQFTIDVYFTHLDNADGTAPPGINTMYLSDDGPSFAHGAITKWAVVDGTWTVVDHITAGTGNAAISFYYLNGSTVADGMLGNVTLYVSYGNGGNANTGPGELYRIIDANGYNAAIGTGGTHRDAAPRVANVSSTSNETYRGVAAFPVTSPSPSPSPRPTPTTPVTGAHTYVMSAEYRVMSAESAIGDRDQSLSTQHSALITHFGGTADTPLGFQATIDLGDGMSSSTGIVTLVDAFFGTYPGQDLADEIV